MNTEYEFYTDNFTKRKEVIKQILNGKYSMNIVPKDLARYFELFINHHHRSHTATQIHKLMVIPNTFYNHNNFVATYTSYGEKITDTIGIGSTVSKTPNRDPLDIKTKKCKQFMRWIIGSDMNDLRNHLVESNPQCDMCGVAVTSETSHLDHCGDTEFRHIADLWLKQNIDKITLKSNPGSCNMFAETDLILDWVVFHHKTAQVQLLCVKCNLSKPKL